MESERGDDLSSIRAVTEGDVVADIDFKSFTSPDGSLPVLEVENGGVGCSRWAVEVEVGPAGSDPGERVNQMLMMDYASHGLWHREQRPFIE